MQDLLKDFEGGKTSGDSDVQEAKSEKKEIVYEWQVKCPWSESAFSQRTKGLRNISHARERVRREIALSPDEFKDVKFVANGSLSASTT